MTTINPIVEITDENYCIKLKRDNFDISLIKNLLKSIQTEQVSFSKAEIDEDDLRSRGNDYYAERFDRLSEK